MDNFNTLYLHIFSILFFCIFWSAFGNPVFIKTDVKDNKYIRNFSIKLDCNPVEYPEKDVIIFKNDDCFIKSKKLVINSENYRKEDGTIFICPQFVDISDENSTLSCKDKFGYEEDEYEILENGSAVVHGEVILRQNYMLKNDELLTCVPDYDDDIVPPSEMEINKISLYVGKIGSGISIIALIIHLFTFCFLPNLRNLPGYNLASLSIAFLLAYSFVLIGQIPQVVGVFCVISAILQQNFFLAAFFCMNVLAFDVWRTLKLATEKLAVRSQNTRKRQFVWYSLYAWGCPLLITAISVLVDNINGVPDGIKPCYGKNDICWLNNYIAKAIFFAAPACTLFVTNGIFFIISFWMISSNTMNFPNDHNKQAVKFNYFLYIRLAMMMGLTWLVGIIAMISKEQIIWLIFDLLNSLQGLFLFLLFTCTRKVMKHFIEKTNSIKGSVKQNSLSINTSIFNSRN